MAKTLRTAAEIAQSRRGTALGYNCLVPTDRRRPVVTGTSSEAFYLTTAKRAAASATVRDDRRNMSILAWMVRRHLDCVSRFTPHFRMPSKAEDAAAQTLKLTVLRLMRWHARRRQFDALGRHGRDEFMRYFEACKILAGDCGALKVQGGRLQGIEADRIATEKVGKIPDNVIGYKPCGIKFDKDGRRVSYMLCRRSNDEKTLVFEKEVPADKLVFDGYWPERFDSDRGVSPLLSAINEAADVREAWEWHLLKIKAAGVFGFAFKRAGRSGLGSTGGLGATVPETETEGYAARMADALKARGLINLDLDPGDDIHEIEAKSPNPNVMPYTREIVRSVLLALDIPFTFYDSLTASFSARIADRNEYEEACEWKRQKNADVLDEIYGGWLFKVWAEADIFGFGAALKAARVDVEEAASMLSWVPAGRPWLDRTGEMSGHILALTAGVTSTPRICAAYGEDAFEIAAEQQEYLKVAGAPLLYASGGQQAVQSIMQAMGSQKPADAGKGKTDGNDDSKTE